MCLGQSYKDERGRKVCMTSLVVRTMTSSALIVGSFMMATESSSADHSRLVYYTMVASLHSAADAMLSSYGV